LAVNRRTSWNYVSHSKTCNRQRSIRSGNAYTRSAIPSYRCSQETLTEAGFSPVKVEICLTPAWTTDWMNAEAKNRLREYGVAPPQGLICEKPLSTETVQCPRCGSHDTQKVSEFGSTACKALYRCKQCLEPFDYFKCI